MTQETFSKIEEISEHGIKYLNQTLNFYAGSLPEETRDELINELKLLIRSEKMKAAALTAEYLMNI